MAIRIENGQVAGIKSAMENLLQQKIAELADLAAMVAVLAKQTNEAPDAIALPDALDAAYPDHKGTIQ